ncbi:NACHT domain-containing protein [Saccharopolyspora spinosa]|uniref:NACHT domain-containing protein n=1 Tax=Saccharopolyspora spinosa TaxID=60894 RepID=UPI001659C4FF|nr:NACHT domain-containing protein [Saccharopolyspora spinosa]
MGDDGDNVSKHSPAAAHNEVSGVVSGPVVQAHSITGDVVITTGTLTQSEVDKWTEGLAQGVQKLWQREENHRRVHDPAPLPVRWRPTPELADHWANIRRLPVGAPAEPLALTGSIEQLTEIYRSIPSGRVVLLGPAGAGKTVLAAHLALDLLKARQPREPVPVIVSVGSWNPRTTPLYAWLAGQLTRDHPGLAAPVHKGGPTRAAALIDAGWVLPILDGFDEIDAGLHPAALRQLNTAPKSPMVITSRVEQYTTAVHGADVLTAAAVVELDELTQDDLADYLPRTTAGRRTGIWDPVLQRMRTEPHGPGPATLRHVLTNPLMVFLARTIYSDTPGHDPTELLDTNRFPTSPALQDRLLAAFIPTVYQADQPDSTRPRWTYDRAHRYLTYLAGHLDKAGTRDLAWWQLRDTIPRWHRTLIFALADGLVFGLAFVLSGALSSAFSSVEFGFVLALGLVYGFAVAVASALTVGLTRAFRSERPRGTPRSVFGGVIRGLAVGLIISAIVGLLLVVELLFAKYRSVLAVGIGLGSGFLFGLAAAFVAGLVGPRSEGPRPTRARLQTRARIVASRFAAGLAAGLGIGLAAAVIEALTSGLAWALQSGLSFGLPAALVGGPALALAFGLEAPTDVSDVASAAQSLAWDRRNAIRKMLTVALLSGLGAWAMFSSYVWPPVALAAMFLSVRATSAWIYWLILVRGWLPLTGRLPWRVQAFLTDAYQRGVLRQTGAVYQIRHARLQDHLTADTTQTAAPAAHS